MFKTILVATDGSEHADHAVRIAGSMAGKYDADLILLHVLLYDHLDEGLRHYAEVEGIGEGKPLSEAIPSIPEARFPVSMLPARVSNDKDTVLRATADLIIEAAKDIAHQQGAKKMRTRIEDGDPAQRILKAAEAEHADLIVLGSRGFSDLKGLVVGSVSHKVGHMATCPVMSVR